MRFVTDSIPSAGRAYLLAVIAAGLSTLIYSIAWAATFSDITWLYFLAAVMMGSLVPVRLPFVKGAPPWFAITLNDIFVFAVLLLFSPEVAVILAATDGLMSGVPVFSAKRFYRALFNCSRLALSTFIVGHLFFRMLGATPPLDPANVPELDILLNLGFAALVYFMLNGLQISVMIYLASGFRALEIWKENILLTAFPTISGAYAAGLIFCRMGRSEISQFVVSIPIFLLAYTVYRVNRERNRTLRRHVDNLNDLYHATMASLAMAIDAKDQCTHGHVYRVQALCLALARGAGMADESEINGLRAAALLHDIGKLAVPEYILNKPSPLTEGEMLKMKAHPSVGADILQTVPFTYPVVPFVRHHHEKWNGTGYPAGLKGDAIPLGARVLAIADSYDALRSDRPYRARLSRELALDYVRAERGKSFDPNLVDLLLNHIDEFEETMRQADNYAPSQMMHELEEQLTGKAGVPSTSVFQNIASTYKEIQAVYEISEAVGKSLSTEETITILAEKIGELVPHDACAIFLLNVDHNRLLLQHASGEQAGLLEHQAMRIGEGVSGWVAANDQPLVNVSPIPDFPGSSVLHETLKTCLSVPLSVEDKLIGVVTLYSKSEVGFHHDHLRLMEAVCQHAAAAISNAMMFEETQEDAYTDPLTDLPNLRYFNLSIEQELRRASRIEYPVTILMMDLEEFKEVNDRFGHKVGDRLLTEVSQVLRTQMRRSDTVIRYAGDEFVAVLPGTGKEQVKQTIERVQTAVDGFAMPARNDVSVRVGISIGSATFPDDGTEIDTLLNLADSAMYANKVLRASRRSGPGDVVPFEKR